MSDIANPIPQMRFCEFMRILRKWVPVRLAGECWRPTGKLDKGGYKRVRVGKETPYFHRLTKYYLCGTEDRRLMDGDLWQRVHHLCGNPWCCNPSHSELVHHLEHVGSDHSGEGNGNSRLTEPQVIEIDRLLKEGVKANKIAKVFGVTVSAVSSIRVGRTWTRVTGRPRKQKNPPSLP